jgi:hypothetical protein
MFQILIQSGSATNDDQRSNGADNGLNERVGSVGNDAGRVLPNASGDLFADSGRDTEGRGTESDAGPVKRSDNGTQQASERNERIEPAGSTTAPNVGAGYFTITASDEAGSISRPNVLKVRFCEVL